MILSFQDYRKEDFDKSPGSDPFAEHNLNNTAAKEMLWYNAWDTGIHNEFYSLLNGINGDGYPHLVETIGVSFSNKQKNPNSGKWLSIIFTDVPLMDDAHFDLSDNEKLPGSYLPTLNNDPFSASTAIRWKSWFLSLLRPFSDPIVTIDQLADPTFIPHNSSLDIINGQSKFDVTIVPAHTHFHDVVPSDIIEPLVNAILEDNVYVQNVTYNNSRTIISRKKIYAGREVNINESIGDVTINSGAHLKFKAGEEVQIMPGFNIEIGGNFITEIGTVKCDGTQEYQQKITVVEDNQADTLELVTIEQNINSLITINETLTSINVFPNPFTDEITIQYISFSDNIGKLIIFDEMGRIVHQSSLENNEAGSSNRVTINLERIKSGVYTCIVEFDEMTLNKKIIKM